jgi:hypothetical protein
MAALSGSVRLCAPLLDSQVLTLSPPALYAVIFTSMTFFIKRERKGKGD